MIEQHHEYESITRFDSEGRVLTEATTTPPGGFTWIDLHEPFDRARQSLSKLIEDSFTITALTAEETRPRVLERPDGHVVILRGINFHPEEEQDDMVSLRLYVTDELLISVSRRPLRTIASVRDSLNSKRGPKAEGELLTTLIRHLFEHMSPVIENLDDIADEAEAEVITNPGNELRKRIIDTRITTVKLRRYMAPQRDVIAKLRALEVEWLSNLNRANLMECYEQIFRYVEELESVRDRLQVIQDELTNAIAEKLNKNMYLLSVVAAIFLPLGFLTGLLGINVGGIPGADNQWAFWIFGGILVVIVVLQLLLFRKMKWL